MQIQTFSAIASNSMHWKDDLSLMNFLRSL